MKVSIIIPVFGVEKYIKDCLISVKNQTFSDFECLIIDDGTKDHSIDIAREMIGADSRFKIFHKENGGLSDARNYGMEKATGDYLFFLDSDDTIDRTLLEKTISSATQYDSDIVCFDLSYVYDDGRENELSVGGVEEVTSYKNNPALIFVNNSSNNKIYRRSFMNGKKFIKGMWYEDLAIVPIWLSQATAVSYVHEPLYFYYQRQGSISHSADPRIFDIYRSIMNIRENLNLDAKDVYRLYYDNCMIMTTLRIKEIVDKQMRLSYYCKNVEYLNRDCPKWHSWSKEMKPNWKRRIIFFLMKHKWINALDKVYNG